MLYTVDFYWVVVGSVVHVSSTLSACKQALQGALTVGQEKEGELATTSLEFEN